jgi:hypothetical protein
MHPKGFEVREGTAVFEGNVPTEIEPLKCMTSQRPLITSIRVADSDFVHSAVFGRFEHLYRRHGEI